MLPQQQIALTQEQRLKLELYREFGDDAREAYDFIASSDDESKEANNADYDNTPTARPTYKDGVYVVYEDGTSELFDGTNDKNDVKYIGVRFGNKSINVALHDLGGDGKEYQFVKDGFECEKHSDCYTCDRDINCFEDFNGALNTERIGKEIETEIPLDLLGGTEYIPSIGEWGIIMMFASTVNKALEYVGGNPIKGWYWSSTESSQNFAWYVNFSSGHTSNPGKYYSYSVRAVAAF